jgi:hypothetical protein
MGSPNFHPIKVVSNANTRTFPCRYILSPEKKKKNNKLDQISRLSSFSLFPRTIFKFLIAQQQI